MAGILANQLGDIDNSTPAVLWGLHPTEEASSLISSASTYKGGKFLWIERLRGRCVNG